MKTILKKEYWNKISNKLIPIFVFLIIFLLTIYNTNKILNQTQKENLQKAEELYQSIDKKLNFLNITLYELKTSSQFKAYFSENSSISEKRYKRIKLYEYLKKTNTIYNRLGFSIEFFEKNENLVFSNLGVMDKNDINKNNIYIFLFPERKIPPRDIKRLKDFLLKLSENNQVIVATFSKYLLDFSNLDSINLYLNERLKNLEFQDGIIKKISQEYPLLKTEDEIEKNLKYTLQKYLFEILACNKVSNKILFEDDYIFIPDYELIFLFLIYLKLSNIPYVKDVTFDKNSPFSNYIEERL